MKKNFQTESFEELKLKKLFPYVGGLRKRSEAKDYRNTVFALFTAPGAVS